jgi:hypothetical protein
LSSASLSAGSKSSSTATSSGIYPYYVVSSISGSAVGKYYVGSYNSATSYYNAWLLVYIGTANTSFSISTSYNFTRENADVSGGTYYAFNSASSAGAITITGTLYC